MSLFKRWFGSKNNDIQDKKDKINERFKPELVLMVVYEKYNDTEEELDYYFKSTEDLFKYNNIGESGPISAQAARDDNYYIPASVQFPFYLIYEDVAKIDYSMPIFYSSDKEKTRGFLEMYG